MTHATISPELGNSTTDRLASMAHETIDRVTPKANRAENQVRGNPLITAGIAFAAGALLTALIRR